MFLGAFVKRTGIIGNCHRLSILRIWRLFGCRLLGFLFGCQLRFLKLVGIFHIPGFQSIKNLPNFQEKLKIDNKVAVFGL